MRRSFVVAALVLAGCQSADELGLYHPDVRHPYEIAATQSSQSLEGFSGAELLRVVREFAQTRPNNGSSFIVRAAPAAAESVVVALFEIGVDPRDVLIPAHTGPAEIVRIDRTATARDCYGSPQVDFNVFADDDGYSNLNDNGAMYGCAIKRNIAAMVDDPRALFVANPATGRDGARAAQIYAKWVMGEPTESTAVLPDTKTTDSLISGEATDK